MQTQCDKNDFDGEMKESQTRAAVSGVGDERKERKVRQKERCAHLFL